MFPHGATSRPSDSKCKTFSSFPNFLKAVLKFSWFNFIIFPAKQEKKPQSHKKLTQEKEESVS